MVCKYNTWDVYNPGSAFKNIQITFKSASLSCTQRADNYTFVFEYTNNSNAGYRQQLPNSSGYYYIGIGHDVWISKT